VIEFEDTMVKEVMVPRLDIVALPEEATLDEIIRVAMAAGYSRMPVYRENLDHIVGIAHVKDLLKVTDQTVVHLGEMVRKPYFVPETKKIGRLLREFQHHRVHMAIVVDEFGAVSGLVTLEDLVEEIVGEIQDEYDEEEKEVIVLPDGSRQVAARMDLDDFNEIFGSRIPEGDYETIGGFVINLLGRLPRVGEEVTFLNLTFRAVEVVGQRLLKLVVFVHETGDADDGEREDG